MILIEIFRFCREIESFWLIYLDFAGVADSSGCCHYLSLIVAGGNIVSSKHNMLSNFLSYSDIFLYIIYHYAVHWTCCPTFFYILIYFCILYIIMLYIEHAVQLYIPISLYIFLCIFNMQSTLFYILIYSTCCSFMET